MVHIARLIPGPGVTMARDKYKTEHAGAKNGGGWWGSRAEAKARCRKLRRERDRRLERRRGDDA